VQDPGDSDARRLDSLVSSFDMVQHSRGPTHRCGNTLDLVLTFADHIPDAVNIDLCGVVSDHALITLPVAFDCVEHNILLPVWSCPVRCRPGVDPVIFDQQDATSHIQWSAIQQAAGTIWRSAGFRAGAATVPSVHC